MTRAGPEWRAVSSLPWGVSPAQAGRLDVYLVWDLLNGFARHPADLPRQAAAAAAQAPAQERWLPLIVELASPVDKALARLLELEASSTDRQLPARPLTGLLSRWQQGASLSSIQTAIVPEALIGLLVRAVDAQVLVRFQLGAPCAAPANLTATPEPLPAPIRQAGLFQTLGLIDDGCCLAHQDMRPGPGQTRLLWLWDQSPDASANGPWQRYGPAVRDSRAPPAVAAAGNPGDAVGKAVGYGVELSRRRIADLLDQYQPLGEAAERAFYADIGRPDWGPPEHTHGARVLHLLAGPHPPAKPALAAAAVAASAGVSAGVTAPPKADALPVIFVQLPALALNDTSGDSLAMHVITGARYVVDRSRAAVTSDTPWQTTLAISLGGIAGPHDGSSLVERALDELATDPARVRIVVSAGNTADHQRVHAQRRVALDAPGDFFVSVPADQRQDSFVEWWLPTDGGSADDYHLVLTPPGGIGAVTVVAGQAWALHHADGQALASVVFARQSAQGLNGSLALLAIAPNQLAPGSRRQPSSPGIWQVSVHTTQPGPVDIHAWIERDDVLVGERRPQQTHFEYDRRQPRDAQYVNNDYTLSSLANGRRLTLAGAWVASSMTAAPYSGRGPCRADAGHNETQDFAPRMVFAPGDRSPTLPGVAVAGFYSGSSATLGGTSAAAPQVARALVESGTTQVTSGFGLLEAGSQPPAAPALAIAGVLGQSVLLRASPPAVIARVAVQAPARPFGPADR